MAHQSPFLANQARTVLLDQCYHRPMLAAAFSMHRAHYKASRVWHVRPASYAPPLGLLPPGLCDAGFYCKGSRRWMAVPAICGQQVATVPSLRRSLGPALAVPSAPQPGALIAQSVSHVLPVISVWVATSPSPRHHASLVISAQVLRLPLPLYSPRQQHQGIAVCHRLVPVCRIEFVLRSLSA